MQQHIVFVSTDLKWGTSISNTCLVLARYYQQCGYMIHLVAVQNKIAPQIAAEFATYTLNEKQKITGFRWIDHRIRAKRLRKIVMQATGGHLAMVLSNLLAADRLVRLAKLPSTVYRIHVAFTESLKLIKPKYRQKRVRLWRAIYRDQKVAGVSQGAVEVLLSLGVQPQRAESIYNGFDFSALREQAQIAEPAMPNTPYIIHVGTFTQQKRHDVLLAAFAKVKQDIKLVLLVEPCAQLHELIQKHQLQERVILPGFQANPYPWIAGAELLVLSSDFEGFGLVLVEALALDTPVVSTNCKSGPAEVLQGALANYLVPVGNVDALTAKIEQALTRPPKITEDLYEQFDVSVTGDALLALAQQ